jgi:hypothetical protein
MKEKLFMSCFGNETNLRLLYALHLKGESSFYKISKTLGLSANGFTRRRVRDDLTTFADLDMIQIRTINHLAEGTRISANPRISKSHVEYRLDNAHELMPSLRALFEEIRMNGETHHG